MISQSLADPSHMANQREAGLRAFVRMLGDMRSAFGEVLVHHGRLWTPQPFPAGYQAGPMGKCYHNAGDLALEQPDLAYVEGYACGELGIPVQHAWCVDSVGQVIDPTWTDASTGAYLGIAIDRDVLFEHLRTTGFWGVYGEFTPRNFVLACAPQFLDKRWHPIAG